MERDGKVGVINIKEKCFSKHDDFEQILVIISLKDTPMIQYLLLGIFG